MSSHPALANLLSLAQDNEQRASKIAATAVTIGHAEEAANMLADIVVTDLQRRTDERAASGELEARFLQAVEAAKRKGQENPARIALTVLMHEVAATAGTIIGEWADKRGRERARLEGQSAILSAQAETLRGEVMKSEARLAMDDASELIEVVEASAASTDVASPAS